MAHRRSGVVPPHGVEPDAGPPVRSPLPAAAIASLAAACSIPIVLYVAAFSGELHPLGPDLFGYVWETRIVGAAPLSEVGTRPGFPVLAATSSGLHLVRAAEAPLILGVALTVTLGLAVAALLAIAFGLSGWELGPIAFTVAVWGGTIHISTGYLANELSLVCMVFALCVVVLPGRAGGPRMAGGAAAGAASGLVHPGLLPFYWAVGGLWLAVSLPALVRGRRAGHGGGPAAPLRFLVVLAASTAVVGVVIFGVLGQRLSDVTNLTNGIRDFTSRLTATMSVVGLWLSAVSLLAGVGVVVAFRLRGRSSHDVIRVGLAWSAAAALGAALTLVRGSFPGHRALLMFVPLPAVAGLGIVGIGRWIAHAGEGSVRSGERGVTAARTIAAAAIMLGCCALVALPGTRRLSTVARLPVRGDAARLVGSYVATVDPHVPVVVVSSPTAERTPFTWRGRQNQVRAYVPSAQIVDTYVVVGLPSSGGVARPGPRSAGPLADRSAAIDASWVQAGPALAAGALVLVPKAFTNGSVWQHLVSDPSRLVTPDLVVLKGPTTPPVASIPPVQISNPRATIDALAVLLWLTALGGGFALSMSRAAGGRPAHAIALAPASGAVLVVLVGMAVSLVGGDPAGPIGAAGCVVAAVAGYGLVWMSWRRHRPAAPTEVSSAT